MSATSICPFCGENLAVLFPSYHHLLSDGRTQFPDIATVDGPITVIQNPSRSDAFYKCRNCKMEYVPKSVDVNSLIDELKVKDFIAPLMNHFYSTEITLVKLIKNYNTGIVKPPKYVEFNLPANLKKRQINICFNYKNIRTFGSFIRQIGSDTLYEMIGLERLKL